MDLLLCVCRYPLRDFGPFVGGGSGYADVGLVKVMAAYVAFRLRHRATSRSQPLCVFKGVFAEQSRGSSARPGGAAERFLRAARGSGDVRGVFLPRGRRVERGKHREISGFRILREGRVYYLVSYCELHVSSFIALKTVDTMLGYPLKHEKRELSMV
ncbi:hypothetical protein Taro_010127 [Colocasia esculenta]|uniref:Uncharacterized protein n=1 Tax=Colocasia esculenta TaxID=4460 RepID=A0A843U6U0_COLES|nr:hypothetical protein [Colocasia esculenta]